MASLFYIGFVRKALFEPIGIKWADMTHISEYDPRTLQVKENTQTLYYSFPAATPPEVGFLPRDWTDIGGGGGWVMSARDLARFWAHLRYGNILSAAAVDLLFPYSSPGDSFVTSYLKDDFGTYFMKRGNASDGRGGYDAWVVDFPGNVQLAIRSNFAIPNIRDSVILPAFKKAWKKGKKA